MTALRPVEQDEAPFDASDERQVAKRQSRAKARDEMRKEGLRRVMSSTEGRAFMQDLLEFCGIARIPFDTHSNRMSFNCGQMNVGQKLQADIFTAGLDGYWIEMMKEANPTSTTPQGTTR